MFHHSGAFSPTPAEASGQHAIAGLPESDAGLYLDDLPVGSAVNVETGHHTYHIENRGDGKALIQGHPKYCPEPVEVELLGSTRGGAMLKMGFIGIGLRMEFLHPSLGMISTSRVVAIHQPALT